MNNNKELMLDVGQANELKLAFRREGNWTNADIKMLCEQKGFLTQVYDVLHKRAEIKSIELVDCNKEPFIPKDWSIEERNQLSNRVKGMYRLDIKKVKLHLVNGQLKEGGIGAYELREKLKSGTVLPANVLDFLLKKENQHLIPEGWKGMAVYFWGTIYSDSCGVLCVRNLNYCCADGWSWTYCAFNKNNWDYYDPAAVLAG